MFDSMISEARIDLLTYDGITDNVSTLRLYHFMSKMNAVTELENYGKEYFRYVMLQIFDIKPWSNASNISSNIYFKKVCKICLR